MIFDRKIDNLEAIDIINITNICKEFSVLPTDGGLLAQDHLLVRKMMLVLQAQDERRKREEKKAK